MILSSNFIGKSLFWATSFEENESGKNPMQNIKVATILEPNKYKYKYFLLIFIVKFYKLKIPLKFLFWKIHVKIQNVNNGVRSEKMSKLKYFLGNDWAFLNHFEFYVLCRVFFWYFWLILFLESICPGRWLQRFQNLKKFLLLFPPLKWLQELPNFK